MPRVNPEILQWARETAGLSREEAAEKLPIRDARGVKAVNRLADLEAGYAEPTRPTLVDMAKRYRRPLLTFYMSAPPRTVERGADFRTLSRMDDPSGNAVVDALIRDMHARQSMVRAALVDEDEAKPLHFVGSMSMAEGESAMLAALDSLLDTGAESFRAHPDARGAFDLLRADVERKGAFVLLKGDLGSHHTAIDAEAFRGFAIADDVAPFIVINDRDARAAWSFTLMHELVHLMLGRSGMRSDWTENGIERFCDSVAGKFLLPDEELGLLRLGDVAHSHTQAERRVSEFAGERNLSRSMVAYRAYGAGLIEREVYESLTDRFRRQWRAERARQRERSRASSGGPNYYVVRRHRVGRALTGLVSRSMRSGTLSTSKAAKVLGVKPTQVGAMLDFGIAV